MELGFELHHTKPDHVTMNVWLAEGECMLPSYATHFCGVGGLVTNDAGELLLIKEERRDLKTSFWKMPGGLVEGTETI